MNQHVPRPDAAKRAFKVSCSMQTPRADSEAISNGTALPGLSPEGPGAQPRLAPAF